MPYDKVKDAKKEIINCDAMLIIAGAGMSVDSGIFTYRGTNGIWNKSIQIDGLIRGQAHVQKSNKYIPNGWEYVFHITKKGITEIDQMSSKVPYNPKWAAGNSKRSGRTHRPTVNSWFIPYEVINTNSIKEKGVKKHPAVFPKELVKQCIKISSLKKGIILDNFMGTGTTGVVAKELGFDFIGIEIDEDYFDLSGHKIQEASKS